MPNTVPNQRLIAIHRERAASDFLGIKNSHWQAAARDLGAHALMLYLYFASNANGYLLALSPAAIRQAVGIPQSTYRDHFTKLIDRSYLVQRGDSNTYDFYETPRRAAPTEKDNTASGYDFTADAFAAPQAAALLSLPLRGSCPQEDSSALPLKFACRFHHVPNTHESCMKDVCFLFLLL